MMNFLQFLYPDDFLWAPIPLMIIHFILDCQWELVTHLPCLMAKNSTFHLASWSEDLLINECEIQHHKIKTNVWPDPDKNVCDPDDDSSSTQINNLEEQLIEQGTEG